MTYLKRHLTMLLAGAILLLTACSGVEESADALLTPQPEASQPVTFNAYINRSTKRVSSSSAIAAEATRGGTPGALSTASLTNLDGTHFADGFGVFAYYTDGRLYSQTALPDFMYNQQVLYDAASPHQWAYSPVKYWPNETSAAGSTSGADHLTFFAYAPYTDVSPTTGCVTDGSTTGIMGLSRATDSGDPYVRYYASMKPTEAVDLCWGLPCVNETKPAVAANVTFNFKHALAALNVQIDTDVDDASGSHTNAPHGNTRIYVRSITFEGFADKGQLNLYSTNAPQWNNMDCDCDLTSQPITLYDGRRDNREAIAEALNEQKRGLNPAIVQSEPYILTPSFGSNPATPGVTNTPVNLFDVSAWPFDDAENPTEGEIAARRAAPVYVIPTNDPMRVTIVYDVETYDPKLVSQYLSDGKTHGSTIENNISADILNGSSPITMEAGHQYTVHLHLGMTSVKVSAKVDDWEFGKNAEVHLPE